MMFKALALLCLIHSIRGSCPCEEQLRRIEDKIDLILGGQRGVSRSVVYESCQALKAAEPDSISGYFLIGEEGDTECVYCNFDTICGNSDGWTRVAYLDMADPTAECPSGLSEYEEDRTCGKTDTGPGCASVTIPIPKPGHYSQVCGRIQGYQYKSPDGLWHFANLGSGIDDPYVDGISITRGSPRTHVFTLINAVTEVFRIDCPCAGSTVAVPSFIGNDYYCESGNPTNEYRSYYDDDILWDAQQCNGHDVGCCDGPNFPYFFKSTGDTSDDLELRVCMDEAGEDVRIFKYELYIQ